jgi:diguanylate cyclase (GGDEF)-like protein
VSTSVCRQVLERGEPVAVLDATLSEALQSQASVAELDLRTLMCVPLAARGQALGVLYVDSRAVVTTFTRKDLELLAAIASHASVAIGNAMLYAESRRRGEELAKALEMYREATRQANMDPLTGLNNRRCFEEMAERELDATRRYQRHLAVVMLDVDHFKSFNDTYGHALGDEVLKAVAAVVADAARVCDVPARLGGEEFVVLCPETAPEGAIVLAERIRKGVMAIRLPDVAGQPVRGLTASLGIAAYRPDDAGLAAMLERADQALYACKRGGRNRHEVWRPDLAEAPAEAVAAPEPAALEVVIPAAAPTKPRRRTPRKAEPTGR